MLRFESNRRVACFVIQPWLLVGCLPIDSVFESYESHLDLSDDGRGGVAVIRGRARTLLGVLSEHCWIISPAEARQITVNPGEISLHVSCEVHDTIGNERSRWEASFYFHALADHIYEFDGSAQDRIQLRDLSEERLVAEADTRLVSMDKW